MAAPRPRVTGKACNIYEGSSDEEIVSRPKKMSQKEKTDREQSALPSNLVYSPTDFQEYGDLENGELGPEGESYVPWDTVVKYPANYIGVTNREKVTRGYFDDGKIYQHTWDLFYIYRPAKDQNKNAIILVPTKQVEHFLDFINGELGINLCVPGGGANGAFTVTFEHDGCPFPRYLGRASDKYAFDNHKHNIPPRYYTLDGEPDFLHPSEKSMLAFKAKIDMIFQAKKGKNLVNKEKAKQDRIAKQQSWNHSVKRVQRYLGLREASNGADNSSTIPRNILRAADAWGGEVIGPASLTYESDEPAPFVNEKSIVFICVDVEAYERNTNIVTEIGISSLDTEHLKGLAPGKNAENWRAKIQARHFRIKENVRYVNKDFVQGCAGSFDFGESEFITLQHAPQYVASCFKPPFSGSDDESAPSGSAGQRNVILVGHDIDADIAYLKKIGYNVHNIGNMIEILDTRLMWASLKRETQFRSLGGVLSDLEIAGWNLHNAGNDAVFTLQAMLGTATKAMEEKQKSREEQEIEKKSRIAEAISEATLAALDKAAGWSSGGEGSDGGVPVISIPMRPKGVKGQTTGAQQGNYTQGLGAQGIDGGRPSAAGPSNYKTNNSAAAYKW